MAPALLDSENLPPHPERLSRHVSSRLILFTSTVHKFNDSRIFQYSPQKGKPLGTFHALSNTHYDIIILNHYYCYYHELNMVSFVGKKREKSISDVCIYVRPTVMGAN